MLFYNAISPKSFFKPFSENMVKAHFFCKKIDILILFFFFISSLCKSWFTDSDAKLICQIFDAL